MNPAVLTKLLTAGSKTATKGSEKSVLGSLTGKSGGLVDRYGLKYIEDTVPVAKLVRKSEFQPRTTASGKGTEKSVFERGYDEGLVDQPLLVRKSGDIYEVLGGHSRTKGMERRAEMGLDNPESVRARIYEGISDQEAKKISRAANQGGQYESTLDMAKSISDSIEDGFAPSVQKQNLMKGYGYDDYKYLWDTVSGNSLLKTKVEEGAISQADVLDISRLARQKKLDPDKTMGIISSLDTNGKLSKQNAKNVINLLSGKYNAGLAKEAQIGLFSDIESAVNSVDLLKNFEDVSREMTRRVNALKLVQKEEGISPAVLKELESARANVEKKMRDIGDEVLARYNKKRTDIATNSMDLDGAVDDVVEGQAGLFGGEVTTTPTPTTKTVSKVPETVKNKPDLGEFKINYNGKAYTPDEFNKLIAKETAEGTITPATTVAEPSVPSVPANPITSRTTIALPESTKVKLDMRILDRQLPSREVLKTMPTEEILEYIPGWIDLVARILALRSLNSGNNVENQ